MTNFPIRFEDEIKVEREWRETRNLLDKHFLYNLCATACLAVSTWGFCASRVKVFRENMRQPPTHRFLLFRESLRFLGTAGPAFAIGGLFTLCAANRLHHTYLLYEAASNRVIYVTDPERNSLETDAFRQRLLKIRESLP